LRTEQSLLFGHRLRPAAKARALQFLSGLAQPLALSHRWATSIAFNIAGS
jgi:hypothetical protein